MLVGLALLLLGIFAIDQRLPEIGPCPGVHGETDTEACLRSALRLGLGFVVVAGSLAASAVTAWVLVRRRDRAREVNPPVRPDPGVR